MSAVANDRAPRADALDRLDDRIRKNELEIAKESPKGRGGPGRGQGRKREVQGGKKKTYFLDDASEAKIARVQARRIRCGENGSGSAALREIIAAYDDTFD